jgi:outer membrane protein TolC
VKVADAYLLTLIAKKLSAIQSLNVERARHLREAVDAGVRSGMRPGVDSSLAHAEYTKATMLLLGSDQNEKTQYYRLRELCGSIEMEVQQLDSMIFFTKLPKQTDYNSMPATTNPLLLAYQTKAKATEARSKMIKLSFLPSISVVGSAWARGSGVSSVDDSFKTDFSSGTNYQVYNYLVGISTRWVISDFFSIHQKYKGEQHLLGRDNELYEHQNLKTKWQVNESNLQYDVALEQARIAPIQLAAARQAYAQANARHKSGLTDMPTFLQSLVTLNRAEADLAIAYSNVWRSLLAIAAAKGDLTDFIDAIKE